MKLLLANPWMMIFILLFSLSSQGQTKEQNDSIITDFPFLEDFSGVETPDLPQYWSKIAHNPDLGTVRVETTTIGTPISEPNHVRMTNDDYEDAVVMLITPEIAGLDNRRISFWARANLTSNIPDLVVGTMSDPSDGDTFNPFKTFEGGEEFTNSYTQFHVIFDDSIGDDSYIAIRHGGTPSFTRTIYLDNILIVETPTSPILLVDPNEVDFGRLVMESVSEEKELEISNVGIGQLSLSPDDISISGPDADRFILENLDSAVDLDPFETATISVAFAPVQAGHKQAVLNVDTLEIPLYGESVDPTITAFPHFEDFNEPDSPDLPLGWSAIVDNPDLGTARVETTTIGSPMSEPQHARIVSNDYDYQTVMMITPPVVDLDEKRIRFWASCNSSSNIPDLIVGTMSDPENAATFTPFRTIEADTELTSSYQQFVIAFDDTVGEDEYIAFLHGTSPNWTRTIYIDDFLLEDIPDGPVMVVEPDSWEFADTQIGVTSFAKEFVIANEGVGTLTLAPEDISITGNDAARFILENLPETIHLEPFESDTISVVFAPVTVGAKQAVLEIDELQIVLSGEAFDATIVDYPHTEDFDDVTTPDLPFGWTKIVDNPEFGSASVGTTDSNDPLSPPNHAWLYSDDTEQADVMLISPPFSDLDNKRLRFYAKCNQSTNIPDLVVGTMSNPSDASTFSVLDTIKADYLTTSYDSVFTVFFDSRTGDDQFVAFKHGATPSFNRYIYLDDILVEATPDEPLLVVQPDGEVDFGELQTGLISAAHSFIIYNDGGGTLNIGPDDIYLAGDDAGVFVLDNLEEQVSLDFGETVIINVAFAPQAVGEKQANLVIDQIQVPLKGEGFDATITEVPHFEDFSEVDTPELPFGWHMIVYNPDLGSAIVETTTSQSPLSVPAHARLYSNDHDEQDIILISPPVQNLDEMRVRFWVKCNMTSNVPDLIVGTMSNPLDAGTFTAIGTIPADQITNIYDEEQTINFSPAIGDDKFIAFKHGGTPSWARSLYIDNILVEEIPDEPILVVTPEAYDFSKQQIGTVSDAKEFTLLNDGGGTLTIAPADISITGTDADDFVLNNLGDDVNLLPGETATISVAFAPEDLGDKTAILEILDEEVLLSGEGFDATVTQFPWLEDFIDDWIGDPAAPLGWTVVNGEDGSYWEQSGNYSYSGDYSARTYQGSGSNNLADEWLISPPLDLDELNNALLSFYGYITQAPDGTRENMRILIMDEPYNNTDDLHANATLLEVRPFSSQWENYTIDISEYSGLKHIAFNYYITEEDDASFAWLYLDDVEVKEAPIAYEVTFQVKDEDENPLSGALVEVDDMDPVSTDAVGEATIDLYDGTYSALVSKEGFEDAQVDFTVDGEPLLVPVTLVQNVFTLSLEASPEDAGTVTGEGDYQADENVTAEAVPQTGYLFINWTNESDEVVSTDAVYSFDMPWEDLTLTANFEAEEYNVTFLVTEDSAEEDPVEGAVISIDGFEDLITGPNGEAALDLTNGTYTADVSMFGYVDEQVTFTVDGQDKTVEVYMMDVIEVPFNLEIVTEDLEEGQALFSWEHGIPEKVFVGFNVFLNGNLVAEEVEENLYLFTELPIGDHTAGVQSVYTTGSSDIAEVDFEIEAERFTVTFNVMDEEDNPITDAVVTFDGTEYDAGEYVIEDVEPGTYDYMVAKEDYQDATGEITVVDENVTVNVTLMEPVETFAVTFNVDLSLAIEHGILEGFDPDVHHIMMTGEMFGWTEPDPAHTDMVLDHIGDDPLTYSITLELEAGEHPYKYFSDLIGDGWEGGEWAGGDDRMVEVTDDMVVQDHFGFTDDEVSVTDIATASLDLFPNPASSNLTIVSDEHIHEIRMIDMLGKVVYAANVESDRYTLNVSEFYNGVYFVQVLTSQGFVTKRVQISR